MNKAIKLLTMFFIMILCTATVSFSAEKDVLLKTTSTWDNAEYKKLKIKNPEATVLKIVIGVNEELPMHKHDLVNIAFGIPMIFELSSGISLIFIIASSFQNTPSSTQYRF